MQRWCGGIVFSLLLLGVLVGSTHLPARAPDGASSPPTHTPSALPDGLAPALAIASAQDAGDAYAPHRTAGSDATLTAINAAQHLTATFLPDGVHFCPTASCMSEEEAWGMRLVSIGTPHTRTTIAPIAPTAEGARIRYNHDDLTEWYINAPLGIEQGFTLNTRPTRPTETDAFVLTVGLDGVQATTTGTSITLTRRDGKRWEYGTVTATDATGRVLPARVDVEAGDIRIGVDDRGAIYPVVVDPLVQEQALTASDGAAGDAFGTAVTLSADGNTALVGAPNKSGGNVTLEGAVYVFVRSGATWVQQTILRASDAATVDLFGTSVAVKCGRQHRAHQRTVQGRQRQQVSG